jgi:class 3 adenylate cyclase
MAKYIHYNNPYSEELQEVIKGLETTPGVCIFIDVINSTGDKFDNPDKRWIRKLNNTFNFISFINNFPDFVVKGIGDELMLYLPDTDFGTESAFQNYYSLLSEIYATMDNLHHHPVKDIFYECKVALHYCTDVYNITFFEGVNDYYGTDIDLSARLMGKARGNRIVLSESFYKKVNDDLRKLNLNIADTVINEISKTYIEDFKGVPYPVEFRKIDLQ